MVGEWRKLHNEELHNFFASPYITRVVKSRMFRWKGHVATMGETRHMYNISVGETEEKRPLGRPKHRGEDNIKIYLRGIGWEDVNCVELVCVMKLVMPEEISHTVASYILEGDPIPGSGKVSLYSVALMHKTV